MGFVLEQISLETIHADEAGMREPKIASEAAAVLACCPQFVFLIQLRIIGMPVDYKGSDLADVYWDIFKKLEQVGIRVCSRVMDACATNRAVNSIFSSSSLSEIDYELKE